MIEQILNIDKSLFLWLNSFHNDFLDLVMLQITHAKNWIPFYLFLVAIIIRKYPTRQALFLIMLIIIAVGLSDFISSGLMKPFFHRLRPCHDPTLIGKMTLVGNCGGQFGFVSSHAANSFALAISVGYLFPKSKIYMLIWATIVAYSRVFLGVHFPLDIIVGAILGVCIAKTIFLSFKLKL